MSVNNKDMLISICFASLLLSPRDDSSPRFCNLNGHRKLHLFDFIYRSEHLSRPSTTKGLITSYESNKSDE
ncbi:hypothetical protein VTN49DRAFT_5462 [Thermomyces lanuginosus]|uniref:uncharacterized protein n=1 Tax=Thermomyces lanuginosus TaxID=5541 RepID=UPI0037446A34